MTADKTQGEGNRLIMFFDGAEESEIEILGKLCPCIKWKEEYYPPDRLPEFHKDWSLLMPVVEKIDKWFDEESDAYFGKALEEDFPRITSLHITSPIGNVWDHVIQFIQWYKLNSK